RGEPGDRTEQRRLAGTVRAYHVDPVSGAGNEVGRAEQHRLASAHGEPGRIYRGTVSGGHDIATRLVRNSNRKNGAPTIAVSTPIGISAGASSVRAPRSARHKNVAPPKTHSGRMRR